MKSSRCALILLLSIVALTNSISAQTFKTAPTYGTHFTPTSVVVGDFNHDGNLDVAVANQGSDDISVLLGKGDGTFQSEIRVGSGGVGPVALVVGDFDKDGNLDLAVANSSSANVNILFGKGDGTFQSPVAYSVGNQPSSIAVGDVNSDGNLDLVVANYGDNSVSVLINNASGVFATAVSYGVHANPSSVVLADLDGNGSLDIAVANQGNASNDVSVLLNQGDGTFGTETRYCVAVIPSGLTCADATPIHPASITIGDLDGDGKPDLAIASLNATVTVLRNTGGGVFSEQTPITIGVNPHSILIRDFNGDGHQDLLITDYGADSFRMLPGKGDGTFATGLEFVSGSQPIFAAAGDFNNDGKLDLVIANSGERDVSIALGMGDGTFQVAPGYGAGLLPNSIAAGDFNGDGKLDLLVESGGAVNRPFTASLLLGNGDGTFQPASTVPISGDGPFSLAVGYFKHDQNLGFVTANPNTNNVTVVLGTGNGAFANGVDYATNSGPVSVAVADINNDGFPDVATANQNSNDVSVLINAGDGTFPAHTDYPVGPNPVSLVAADLNGDGFPDIVVANSGNKTVSVILNKGDGTFAAAVLYPVGNLPKSVAVADLNKDGRADLVVLNSADDSVSVLIGNGDGTFMSAANYSIPVNSGALFVTVGDVTGNGITDIVVADTSKNIVSVLPGIGDGTFGLATNYSTGINPVSIAVGDFNGDHKFDLATANVGSNDITMLFNTSAVSNSATSTVISSSSNPSKFGQNLTFTATVSATAAGVPTGSITFSDGAVALGTVSLAGNLAFLNVSGLGPGSHSITAIYSGDSNFSGSTSIALSQTVTSIIALSSSANPSSFGQSVTFSGTDFNTNDSEMRIFDGSTLIGDATFAGNGGGRIISFTTASLSAGTHTITAAGFGVNGIASGTSSTVVTQVVLSPALVSLTVTPTTAAIPLSGTQQFVATGTYSDGSTQDLTSGVTWSSSAPTVGGIAGTGLATAIGLGQTTIRATLGSITASASLNATPGFVATGDLSSSRAHHTATLLTNGMVLLAGGISTCLASAELYDPATGVFSPTGDLNVARASANATLLGNGTVLITGGQDCSNNPIAAAETYSPSTGTFTPAGTLLSARYHHTATMLQNGMVLITGGIGVDGYLTSAELYDPATGHFFPTGTLNAPRELPTATLLDNGKVLIIGGDSPDGDLTSAELYDSTSGTFVLTGSLNTARIGSTATALNDGTVLVAGGNPGTGVQMDTAELFNPATGGFTFTGNMNTGRGFHTATLLNNGMVLIAGGIMTGGMVLNNSELYDPAAGKFTATGSLNIARFYHTSTMLQNGDVLTAGGASTIGYLAKAELYKPGSLTIPGLVSITVSPATSMVPLGTGQPFTAVGTFSDSTSHILRSVTWNSSNITVATVSNDASNQGTAVTSSGGTSIITGCDGYVCGAATLTVGVPVASLSTSNIPFGNQIVGTSSAITTVTLTNIGTAPISFSMLGLAGTFGNDYYALYSCPIVQIGHTLGIGASCTIDISFRPTATGPRPASFVITDNATGSPQTISLSGTGVLPSINLTPATLAFGNQATGTTGATKNITLSNPGTGVLSISNIALAGANSSDFGQTNNCGPNVAASGSCTITVKFSPLATGGRSASVVVADNSAGSPHAVTLTGTGVLPLAIAPTTLAFGNQGVGSTSAAKTVTLTNNSGVAVTFTSKVVGGANAGDFSQTATTCATSVAPTKSCTVSISFTPSAAAAETASLTITDNASNSPQTATLTGTGVQQVTVSAATLAFGNQGLNNTSAAKTVALTNNTSAAISVSGIVISGTSAAEFAKSATTCGATLNGHASCTISLTFTPATAGAKTATVTITDGASNNPQTVALTGTGVQPVTLSAVTLAFGNQGIGSTSAAKTVTITNNNSVPLTFSGMTTTGANASDFVESATTCGSSIAAHAACTVSVTYTPSISGAESATLTITDSAGNSPQSANLTGSGVAQFTLAAGTIAFGNQAYGTTSVARNVTLTNNTNAAVAISSISLGGTNPANFAQSATTCGTNLNKHSSCTISFTFSPSVAASYVATATITDGASNSPQSVSLTGTGLVPVSVTPLALTYASQTVGTTSAGQTVTVKNNLAGALTISSISFTGSNAADFPQSATTCGTSLAAGASCTVSVKFKPTAIGARSATLSVTDTASTSPQIAALSGTGK